MACIWLKDRGTIDLWVGFQHYGQITGPFYWRISGKWQIVPYHSLGYKSAVSSSQGLEKTVMAVPYKVHDVVPEARGAQDHHWWVWASESHYCCIRNLGPLVPFLSYFGQKPLTYTGIRYVSPICWLKFILCTNLGCENLKLLYFWFINSVN